MGAVTAEDPLSLCVRVYYAAGVWQRHDPHTRWVMDLGHYKRIRAECEARSGDRTDPETWIPDPGDRLLAIPVDVRADGGEPHLEAFGEP